MLMIEHIGDELDEDAPDAQDLNRPIFRGRPPKYATVEELEDAITGYFNGGMKQRQIWLGKGDARYAVYVPVPTITGLVLYLGFADRASFYDLEKNPDFSHTIKKARTFIETEYEEILATTGNAGAIFALKNFGWHDKTEIEHSGELDVTRDKIGAFLDERTDYTQSDDAGAEPTADDADTGSEPVAETPTDIS